MSDEARDAEAAAPRHEHGLTEMVAEQPPDHDLTDAVAEQPVEAVIPLGPAGLAGSAVTGALMGTVELVPGFSGGTVALVAGVYERLIGNIRQGARVLALLLRGRIGDAWRAFLAIEWPFVLALFGMMATAVLIVADALNGLLEDHPVEMSAVFLGLVIGAALLATRQIRSAQPWHWLLVLVATVVVTVALGFRPPAMVEPSLLVLGAGSAIAVCAWILPGISGAFVLLFLGLYHPFVAAIGDRDPSGLAVIAVGLVVGLASFSTLLNWLLMRAHDAVLAVAIGLMLGSARILWPWPSDAGVGGSTTIGTPVAPEALPALVLGTVALVLVCAFGTVAGTIRTRSRQHAPADARSDELAGLREGKPGAWDNAMKEHRGGTPRR